MNFCGFLFTRGIWITWTHTELSSHLGSMCRLYLCLCHLGSTCAAGLEHRCFGTSALHSARPLTTESLSVPSFNRHRFHRFHHWHRPHLFFDQRSLHLVAKLWIPGRARDAAHLAHRPAILSRWRILSRILSKKFVKNIVKMKNCAKNLFLFCYNSVHDMKRFEPFLPRVKASKCWGGKLWPHGDSETGPGDISPAPFCPITRLLCGHRAPMPRASIQYSLLTNVLLCLAGAW